MHMRSAHTCVGHKRVLDSQELELQAVASHPMWVLETELGSFRRTVCTLHDESSLQRLKSVLEVFKEDGHFGAGYAKAHL